eukprot:TRINITY_DN65763_c0_g1_i1.p2 TRINITY_DN65763_c0_g1~~TRINITY_DN65763_c0_g1_i1.p2  ORF type:complete len:241 (+),score=45.13 TRINITY_DN65763_c0_g1_i1:93-815(+)
MDGLQRWGEQTGLALRHHWDRLPSGVRLILATTGAVTLVTRGGRSELSRHFWCSWDNTISGRRFHTLFTSAFLHLGALHLLFNGFALAALAPPAYPYISRRDRDLQFTGLCLGASATSFGGGLLVSRALRRWNPYIGQQVGAGMSGALYALLGVHAAAAPTMQFRVIFSPEPIDARSLLTGLCCLEGGALLYCTAAARPLFLGHHVHLCGAAAGWWYGTQVVRPQYAQRRRPGWYPRTWT